MEKGNANRYPPKTIGEFSNEAYALSAGWAAWVEEDFKAFVGGTDVGHVFEWMDFSWEIVSHFKAPCCSKLIALVRKVGSGIDSWQGVRCPVGCTDESWTVEST